MQIQKLVAVSALVFIAAAITSAQSTSSKRPMTFEDLMAMKRLGDTAVSPDGKWLGYSETTVNLDLNTKTAKLWLQAIAGGGPVSLTVAKPGDSGVQFSPDGKRILFLSSRTGAAQIWLADFDSATGTTTHERKLTNLDFGLDNANWSPDGGSILFTAAVYPDCPAIVPNDGGNGAECTYQRDAALAASKVQARVFTHLLYRHWDHYNGDKRTHLFLVSVENGDVRDLTPNDPHNVPPEYPTENMGCGCAFAPDSKELAFTENVDPEPAISTNTDIFTLDLTNPSAKPVKVSTSPGGDFSPAYSPDGKYLAWRSQARAGYESDKFRLVLYDRRKKAIRDLMPKFQNWIDEFAWSPDSRQILFVSEQMGNAPIFIINADGSRNAPDVLVSSGNFSDLHASADGKTLLAAMMRVQAPSEVAKLEYLGPGDSERGSDVASNHPDVSQITHLNDALLSQLDLPKMEDFWFNSTDGATIQGFLIRPPGFDPAKKYPVKFLIHGGPQEAWGDSWSYRWNAELFAADGYVVIMINPRGSTGYGQAFVDGVNNDWGGKPFTDLITGLTYAEQHFSFIDKNRECALGASYGGYMANWILGHTNRFKCIVSHDGVFNPESTYGSTEELWFNEWEFQGKPWDYYGKPDSENPFRKWSPALSASNFHTPTLVVHGQLDYRLDLSEGFQLFTTLQRLGVPSKMLYFPDEGHWVLKPQNSRLWYKTVDDWVDHWTGTRATSQ